MKKILLNVKNFNKKLITYALEKGISDFLVYTNSDGEKIKNLGRVNIFYKDDLIFYTYENREDEDKIEKLSKEKPIILKSKSWEIIPWENLIAKNVEFFVFVKNIGDLKKATGVLEKGVSGIIIDVDNLQELEKIIGEISKNNLKIELSTAVVKKIKVLGTGERVCVDTCNLMEIGEGMLVGSSSSFMFLVHSETIKNPYCEPRPFRVNAGAVFSYIKTDLQKTKYLSELEAGDEVLIVNSKGNVRTGIVGRCKIELRPLILIEAEVNGKSNSIILQNAETINLIKEDGTPVSVVKLKEGDKVLVHLDEGGRHFGIKIEEKIIEK